MLDMQKFLNEHNVHITPPHKFTKEQKDLQNYAKHLTPAQREVILLDSIVTASKNWAKPLK